MKINNNTKVVKKKKIVWLMNLSRKLSITFEGGDSATGVIPWLVFSVDLLRATRLGDDPT